LENSGTRSPKSDVMLPSEMTNLRIPRDVDQRSELMSITVPK